MKLSNFGMKIILRIISANTVILITLVAYSIASSLSLKEVLQRAQFTPAPTLVSLVFLLSIFTLAPFAAEQLFFLKNKGRICTLVFNLSGLTYFAYGYFFTEIYFPELHYYTDVWCTGALLAIPILLSKQAATVCGGSEYVSISPLVENLKDVGPKEVFSISVAIIALIISLLSLYVSNIRKEYAVILNVNKVGITDHLVYADGLLINSGNTPAAILEADIVMTAGFPISIRKDGFYSSVDESVVLQPGEMKSVNFSVPKDFLKAGIPRVSVDGGEEQELRILTIKVEAVDIHGNHHFKYCYLGKIFWDNNKIIDQVKGLVFKSKWDSEKKESINEIIDEIKYVID